MKTLKARALAVLLWSICGLCALLDLQSFAAQSVTLAWDPSPDPDVVGYNIYYGLSSGAYTNRISLAAVTNAVVSGLVEGATYYFTATAYDSLGLESEFSNEVSYSVPTPVTNAPPTLNALTDLAINENAGLQTVNLSGISSGSASESQTLSVSALSSNPALIPNPTVGYASPNATGTLKFSPALNGFGTAKITVTVNDGQSTNNAVTRSFTVTVNVVGQPPTLDPLNDLTIDENAGPQSVVLSGISGGTISPGDPLLITAVSSDPTLIPRPAIDYTSPNSTGTLTFSPVRNLFGSARIGVTVDNGQPTNNLVRRSFKVTVRGTIAQVGLGSTILQTGTSGSVTVDFSSATGLTTLDLLISQTPGHLTNFALQALVPEIDPNGSRCTLRDDSSLLLHFAARRGKVMAGTKQIANLAFTALDGKHSGFVPLQLLEIIGTQADASLVTNRFGHSGRVVVLGPEALLESTRGADSSRTLTLYGIPNYTYAVEYTTNLAQWIRMPGAISLQTFSTTFPTPEPAASNIYCRAVELNTGPTGP